MGYLDKINKNTLENGRVYQEQKQVTNLQYEAIASLHDIKATCNGYAIHLELAQQTIFSYHCNCIIGQNNVLCKHVVAVILEFMQQKELLQNNEYEWLSKITENRDFLEVFKLLSANQKWYRLVINTDNLHIECLYPELLTTIKQNMLEMLRLLRIEKTKINSPNVSRNILLEQQLEALIGLSNLINKSSSCKLELQQLHEILIYQKLITVVLNHHEYAQNLVYDEQKIVFLHATKTSIGYILYPDFKEAYYCIQSDHVGYFLIFNDYIQWFISDWNHCDSPNIILKLNIRTAKLSVFQERLSAIKNQSLFRIFLTGEIGYLEPSDELILAYNFEKQKCELKISSADANQIVNQFFTRHQHLYDDKSQVFTFNDNYNVYSIMKTLERLQKYENFKITIDPIFNNCGVLEVDYDFSISDKLKLNLNINNLNVKEQNEVLKAYRKKHKYIAIGNKLYDLDTLNFDTLKNSVLNTKKSQSTIYSEYKFDKHNIFFLESKFKNPVLKRYVDELKLDIENYQVVSKDFMPHLKPYQVYGVNWLIKILDLTQGCILADEMGLGKTLQTICLLKFQASLNKNLPSLIIVPLSLINNWIEEFKKFWPEQKIIPISGSAKERALLIDDIKPGFIYLSTYNLVKNDINLINQHQFLNIILDEGQYIKNHKTIWTKLIKTIKTTNKLILSGTPIENNLMELWSIFDFIIPNYLPPLSKFKRTYCRLKTSEEKLQELSLQVNPFILKRKKIDHLDLPEKHINDIIIEMSIDERKAYQDLFKQLRSKINVSTDDSGNIVKNRIEVLALITRLRQFCCSAKLLNYEIEFINKLKRLFQLIEEILAINPKAKIVIFSNFSSMLELLSISLDDLGYKHLIMTGKNTSDERRHIIKSFNQPAYAIFLLSLKVGGVGLNLTMADHVIHYNPWWNESAELQATDRLHRIGQIRDVHVYRLLYENSIETDIQQLKQNKTNLIDKMINEISYNDLIKLLKSKID